MFSGDLLWEKYLWAVEACILGVSHVLTGVRESRYFDYLVTLAERLNSLFIPFLGLLVATILFAALISGDGDLTGAVDRFFKYVYENFFIK